MNALLKWSMVGSCLIGALLAVTEARAQATKTPVSGEITGAVPLGEERRWLDDEGVGHIRGGMNAEFLNGDLAGTLYTDHNFNVEIATGDGDLTGKFLLVDVDETPIFEGSFDGVVTGWYFDGTWTGHGVGAHKGQKLFIHNYGSMLVLPQIYEGTILDPHGN